MQDYRVTIKECLEDIKEAQKALDKAYYHLRIAVELSMSQREWNEEERNSGHNKCEEMHVNGREENH